MSNFMNTDTKTYKEDVGRFRILRHTDQPEEHKAALRAGGMDPDDVWSLIWSFNDEAAARCQLLICQDDAHKSETYKLVDNGEASVIERPIY